MIRWVFVKDGDSHDYMIPLKKLEDFLTLEAIGYETDNYDEFEQQYGNYRCHHPHCYSFTNPEKIE